ncbi:hypothetical protein CAL7716_051990 [Calothrix sp. PCC 7716]|nr:hypothetical protein CAL7716_051990 [Calothrix sp. PCC 7716]
MRFDEMSYKIRRSKSQVQASRGIETNQSRKHQNVVEILKSQIVNLNIELRCKTQELEYIKSSRDIEQEVYYLVISTLLNSGDDNELSKRLEELDKLLDNLINDLLDVFNTSNYSARQQ